MNLAYPYRIAPSGGTAATDDSTHIRDMIEQVLFTAPGERVMRPDFGCGAARLVFAPNSVELASATQMLIQASLQQWMNAFIVVQSVDVTASDATLAVTVQYTIRATGQSELQSFTRSLSSVS
jgi:phage baseplate assembly protein W